ncbi:MAG: hypothetical protein J6U23_05450 [Clostridiales bacterium]|nr:hypothetical protein [Clostridiales bacterium]
MRLLLLLTVIGFILITLGLTGLYFDVTARLRKIEKSMKAQDTEIRSQKRDIRVIKERDAAKSDKVVITYEPNDKGIKYGGF